MRTITRPIKHVNFDYPCHGNGYLERRNIYLVEDNGSTTVGYDVNRGEFRRFRNDKMRNLCLIDDTISQMKWAQFDPDDLSDYLKERLAEELGVINEDNENDKVYNIEIDQQNNILIFVLKHKPTKISIDGKTMSIQDAYNYLDGLCGL